MKLLAVLLPLALALPAFAANDARPAVDATDILRKIDARMSVTSDYKGIARIREKRPDGSERALEVTVYRRDASEDLIFLVSRPPSIAGSGFLRIGRNLWEYSALVGQWERRTRRADLIGTITCESDFDRSRLSTDYTGVDDGTEEIKGVTYRKLLLNVKPGVDTTFPILRIWVDPDLNIVKRIGYAPSGKPLRSDVILSYQKLKDPANGHEFYHYKEVVERQDEDGTLNIVRYDSVELGPLEANMFTKAWFEGRGTR